MEGLEVLDLFSNAREALATLLEHPRSATIRKDARNLDVNTNRAACRLDYGHRDAVTQELETQRLARTIRSVRRCDDSASTLYTMRLFRRHALLHKIARSGRRCITPHQLSGQITRNLKKSDY